MVTCRCPMCGRNRSGHIGRRTYVRFGVRCDEDGPKNKRGGRRRMRRMLKVETETLLLDFDCL